MNRITLLLTAILTILLLGCTDDHSGSQKQTEEGEAEEFQYVTEKVADLKILRYQVPGFEMLSLNQKKLLYYLYEASLAGRDIMYDQNFKHNLCIRRTMEAILATDGCTSAAGYDALLAYTKRIWFSNGIHHHYSNDKLMPEFSKEEFSQMVRMVAPENLPLSEGEEVAALVAKLTPIMFDPAVAAKKVNKNANDDIVATSAVNFYEGVTEAEVDAFYDAMKDKNDKTPISYGLNSKLIKKNGQIQEKVWKVGGMYTDAIEKIVYWLEKAATVAENPAQKKSLELLIKYYKSGDLKDFDEYSIAWVQDTASDIDMINGFIEVYNDPKGYRGSYESIVQIRDPEASKRIEAIGKEAQWFEDQSPIMDAHKKANVTGISARVINVAIESGDAAPATPIGVNLPNANWIRAQHGSKSVNLANIVNAYDEAAKASGGSLAEFAYTEEEMELSKKHGYLADLLHTDMHEVIGHASGQIEEGIGTPKETLRNYSSTIEEGRADLVGLYYIMDQKLIELGLMESMEVAKAGYNDYIRNGLMTQLRRIKLGDDIEEAHMRNRAWVSYWAYEKGQPDKVIEKLTRDGKTFFKINDYQQLKEIFGELLREVQRIKSQGDYDAAKALVEGYGVKVDQELHKEVLDRYAKLNTAPYSGFINPVMKPVMNGEQITDVKIEYPMDFKDQMMFYAEKYSFLPTYN